MKKPDEQIADSVGEKLKESKKWDTKVINKLTTWIAEGNATALDLIFLIENQRPVNKEALK